MLFEGTLAVFVVELSENGRAIGMVQAYKCDYRNGTVSGAVLCESSEEARAAPVEAFALLSHYIFTVFPIRVIHLEMVEFNYRQVISGAGTIFEIEGRLRGNEYYDGRYWDTYILTIRRETAMPLIERLFQNVNILNKRDDALG